MIYIYALNIERYPSLCPGGKVGEFASEDTPGINRGFISYTRAESDNKNNITEGLWKDGHGHNIKTVNIAMPLACSTSERLGIKPMYLQKIWDTDLNKEVTCIDEANKTWVDANANNGYKKIKAVPNLTTTVGATKILAACWFFNSAVGSVTNGKSFAAQLCEGTDVNNVPLGSEYEKFDVQAIINIAYSVLLLLMPIQVILNVTTNLLQCQ